MFQDHFTLMASYEKNLAISKPELDFAIAKEALSRFRQLTWLYSKITELEARVIERYEMLHGPIASGTNVVIVFSNLASPDNPDAEFTLPEQLCLLGECFYESAFRLIALFDECQAALPGLTPPSAKGVRRVRNNLLVHANKKAGTTLYMFSVSNAGGLRLRPAFMIDKASPYLDKGFKANAAELSNQLLAILRSANAA